MKLDGAKPYREFTAEQTQQIGRSLYHVWQVIAGDVLGESSRTIKRRDVIEMCADYVNMHGDLKRVTDPVALAYLENMDDRLVDICRASGYWEFTHYGN